MGASDHFYSYPAIAGERTLDDDITDVEDGISKKLNLIRAKQIGSIIDAADAAEIIDHLVPRTAHVRVSMERGLRMMADGIGTILGDEDRVQTLIGLDEKEPNEAFRKALAEKLQEFEDVQSLGIPMRVIERVAFFQAKENFGPIAANALPALRELLSSWLQSSDGVVREAHNKTVKTVSNSAPRMSLLKELDWAIQSAPKEGAVLPDCAAIAFDSAGESSPAMFADWKNVAAIVMPIAPDRLLVGAAKNIDAREFPDFNSDAARCSHDFFLAQENNEYLVRLQGLLGQRSTKLIEDGVNGAFAQYRVSLPKPRDKDEPLFPVDLITPSSEPWQYELTFIECGDTTDIQEVSDAVSGILSVLTQALPLQRLDGITVATDYLGAVAALDRGHEEASVPESVPEEIGRGVARTISVKRDGRWKERIIIDASVAFTLLVDDKTTVDWAAYIVTRQLTEVAITEIIERSLPGVWMSKIDDPLHSFLYPSMHPAIIGYLTSHICAGFGDTAQQSIEKRALLMSALHELKSAVLSARLEYRSHGELDTLVAVAMPRISYALQFAADLLGHCAASNEDPFDIEGELSAALTDVGLENWFPTCRDQLEQFRMRLGRWESFDEFLALDIHVERLMWQLGMLPWQGPEGIRIEVPLGTDIDRLVRDKQN